MAYSKPYTKLNFVAFTAACFFTISFVVFMSSTQSFFLTDVLGISTKIGDYIGTLGFADELVSMSIAPFLGALSDKIGAKYINIAGVIIVGVSFFLYTTAKSVYPHLLFLRMIFAVGATASASMMTAMLAEMSASGFELSSLLRWGRNAPLIDNEAMPPSTETLDDASADSVGTIDAQEPPKRNGKLTSVIGMASGSGAVFAAMFYIPLPNKFAEVEPPAPALKHSYMVIGTIALACSTFLAYGLFSPKSLRIPFLSRYFSPYDDVLEGLDEEEDSAGYHKPKPYLELLKLGFGEARNKKIALAYLGGFVARSTTVTISVFIPLYVNSYYMKSGLCDATDRSSCREAYIQAAILTGIIHTVSLVFAPVFGFVCDKYGRKFGLIVTSLSGIIASLGYALVGNPRAPIIFIFSIIFGVSMIGTIITSMSLATDKQRDHNGAISGVYGFCGGTGILLISKVGGYFSDIWAGAPFIIMAIFHGALLAATLYKGDAYDVLISKLTGNNSYIALTDENNDDDEQEATVL